MNIESALVAKFGKRYRKHRAKNGMEYKVCCPFCTKAGLKPDRKYKLWINPDKQVYRCWRCDARGRVSDLLGVLASTPVFDARPRTLSTDIPAPGELIGLDQLEGSNPACVYMANRGFNPVALGRYYGVQHCYSGRVFGGKYMRFNTTNTIVFPIIMDTRVVGWQSRLLYNPDALTDAECEAMAMPRDDDGDYIRPPKYFTSPGLTKADVLYNFDTARSGNLVVVVEGPTDVLATGPAAVGTLGKGVSDQQASMLKTFWDLVIVMLDPGDAARESAKLVEELSGTVRTVEVRLERYDDPGSAPTLELWRQIDVAMRKQGLDLSNYKLGPQWCNDVLKRK